MADSGDFSCDFCEKPFSSKGNLKKHYDKNHGGPPASYYNLKTAVPVAKPCPYCGSVIKQLPKHMSVCKAKPSSNTVAVSSTFQTKSRALRMEEGEQESEDDLVPGTPVKEVKRPHSKSFDLKGDFLEWLAAHNIAHSTMAKYVGALSNFLGIISIQSVTDKNDYLPSFINRMETVGGRNMLYKAHVKLVEFLKANHGTEFEILHKPAADKIIQVYLKSQERKNLCHNFVNIAKAMEMGWSPLEIHDFLMGEVLLCTKEVGKEFLHHFTLADFRAVTTADRRGRWVYEVKNFKVSFSPFFRQMLQSFAFIVRPRILKTKKSHDVKFFDILDRPIAPCTEGSRIFKYVEDFSKALEPLKMDKVLEANYKFTTYDAKDFVGEIPGIRKFAIENDPIDDLEDSLPAASISDFGSPGVRRASSPPSATPATKQSRRATEAKEVSIPSTSTSVLPALEQMGREGVSVDKEASLPAASTSQRMVSRRPVPKSSIIFRGDDIAFLKQFFAGHSKQEIRELEGKQVITHFVLNESEDSEEFFQAKMGETRFTEQQLGSAIAKFLQEILL